MRINHVTEVGKIIKKGRVDANITQKDLAEYLGVTITWLSKLETKTQSISIETVYKILEYFESKNIALEGDIITEVYLQNNKINISNLSDTHKRLVILTTITNVTDNNIELITQILKEENN